MKTANKRAADAALPPVQRRARGSWPNLAGGTSRLGGVGLRSIKAQASQSKALIVAGGARAPWFGGVDYGSAGRYRQFGPQQSEGRIIYPGIDDAAPKIIDVFVDELDSALRGAFPEGKL